MSTHVLVAGGFLAQYKIQKERPEVPCCIVVDCGYSFTHIIPYYNGKKILTGLKRYAGCSNAKTGLIECKSSCVHMLWICKQ